MTTYRYSTKVRRRTLTLTCGLPGGGGGGTDGFLTNLPRPTGDEAVAWRLLRVDWFMGAEYEPSWVNNSFMTLSVELYAYTTVPDYGEISQQIVRWQDTQNDYIDGIQEVTRHHPISLHHRSWESPGYGFDLAVDRFEANIQHSVYNEGVMGGLASGYMHIYYKPILISLSDWLDLRRQGV